MINLHFHILLYVDDFPGRRLNGNHFLHSLCLISSSNSPALVALLGADQEMSQDSLTGAPGFPPLSVTIQQTGSSLFFIFFFFFFFPADRKLYIGKWKIYSLF